ncbi:hypothetical protein Droror1_Dr00003312 [Drosera rotundifolia]
MMEDRDLLHVILAASCDLSRMPRGIKLCPNRHEDFRSLKYLAIACSLLQTTHDFVRYGLLIFYLQARDDCQTWAWLFCVLPSSVLLEQFCTDIRPKIILAQLVWPK